MPVHDGDPRGPSQEGGRDRRLLLGRRRPAMALAGGLLVLAGAAAAWVLEREADPETTLDQSFPPPDLARPTGRAEALFTYMLRDGADDDLGPRWQALGLRLRTVDDDICVVEDGEGAGGRYLLRSGETWPLAIEAPHSFFDRHTGTIAKRLFAEGRFAAGAWNTVPRRSRTSDGERVVRDLAHQRDSYFNAFTRAFGRARPDGLVVQLHGFARAKRRTTAGRTADLILSDATRVPGPAVRAAAACLEREMDAMVRLYPIDVRELGGVTNANAAALRELGLAGRFLHVEISPELRLRLRDEAEIRARFMGCLLEVLEAVPTDLEDASPHQEGTAGAGR